MQPRPALGCQALGVAWPSSRSIVRGVLTGIFALSILGLAVGLIGLVAGLAVDVIADRAQASGGGPIDLPRPLVLLVLVSTSGAVLSGLILAADDYRRPPP
jgi:hypothetical protein